jgi:hypothetical protein
VWFHLQPAVINVLKRRVEKQRVRALMVLLCKAERFDHKYSLGNNTLHEVRV